MSEFFITLRRVMLLQHVLENGGTTRCPMQRPETSIDAHVEIENDLRTHQVKVTFGPATGTITLQRGDSSKYMALRDFLQDLANGRTESGRRSGEAIAMREALESVNAAIGPEHTAYISPTIDPKHPFRVIVLDDLGDICASTKGHCKDQLVETVRRQLRPTSVGHGDHQ
ncbi:hypothetical protein [Pseudomonas putida]|uniref:Uncharacterized protein n=1 Tax=Pseudomonas putida TaxID=303 RepID=A0AAW4C0V0_PSEPU|nr:hypothetical protein [Pseudomonas putida]MBF8703324.1 hypothetical protein [Pseudomonas putida]MBF8737483.1 hypothetical protein [Pseudomonas putida]